MGGTEEEVKVTDSEVDNEQSSGNCQQVSEQ